MNVKRKRTRWFVLAVTGLVCALLVGSLLGDAAAQPKPEGRCAGRCT